MDLRQARLGINIDHVATLGRLRDTPYPDLLRAAEASERGGADQITVHLREDRRHITDRDVFLLRNAISTDLNLEMAATSEMLAIALKIRPYSICLVPEKREERTTEGGLGLDDLGRNAFMARICREANAEGIRVSFFVEADPADIQQARALGAGSVEIHTGQLCLSHQRGDVERLTFEWTRLREAIEVGNRIGLAVHAGHGIDYRIASDLALLEGIAEYNIGHSVVCEAVFTGLEAAVARMKHLLQKRDPT